MRACRLGVGIGEGVRADARAWRLRAWELVGAHGDLRVRGDGCLHDGCGFRSWWACVGIGGRMDT